MPYSVNANGYLNIPIPTNVNFLFDNSDSWNSIPPIGINIKSDSPVTIFGQNILSDSSSGDIFTVLPVSALGTSYYVPLADSKALTSYGNRVLVIPTHNNTLVSFENNVILNLQSIYQYDATNAMALSFNSSQPVAVIAGTTCFGLENGGCDYRAFMPMPTRCGQTDDNLDTHPVMDLQGKTDEYILAAECEGTTSSMIDGGSNGQLTPNNPIYNLNFDQNDIAHVVSCPDSGRYIQLIRSLPSFGGAILGPILSVSQYVANTSLQFFVPQTTSNYAQIVADASAMNSLLMDGAAQPDLQWKAVPVVNGYQFSYATATVGQGFHQFSATGTFSVTVYGFSNGSYSYSYIPAFNTGHAYNVDHNDGIVFNTHYTKFNISADRVTNKCSNIPESNHSNFNTANHNSCIIDTITYNGSFYNTTSDNWNYFHRNYKTSSILNTNTYNSSSHYDVFDYDNFFTFNNFSFFNSRFIFSNIHSIHSLVSWPFDDYFGTFNVISCYFITFDCNFIINDKSTKFSKSSSFNVNVTANIDGDNCIRYYNTINFFSCNYNSISDISIIGDFYNNDYATFNNSIESTK
uniref:IgGFc-binding protein N-terminal domain-containing protein n=1 Tax=Plectus sambesii TaxID=2011161 RepID=A0A914VE20_9BILA